MSTQGVVIRFEGPEAWQEHNENVNNILEKATGESTYPSTRSLPPIIFGLQLRAETIAELTALGGVFVDIVALEVPQSPVSSTSRNITELHTDHAVMPQWMGSLTSQNGNSLAGVFMINGEPWVFEKNARGQPAVAFRRAPAVVNIPWKELESIRQSLQSREPFTATIMGSTMEITWSNGVRITANVPHCDTYGYFSGEGGWRTQ